jgi:hypothetical protein
LTPDPASNDSGTVSFPAPLLPGQYTYFSLESPFSGSTLVTGNPNDALQISLTDGTTTGAHLVEPAPTGVNETALITPSRTPKPSGKITFAVYSDAKCTEVVDGPVQVSLSGNRATSPVFGSGLHTGVTYYLQASYPGDANYNPTTTNCGDATVTFGRPPSKLQPTVTTKLIGSDGTRGTRITVTSSTSVRELASVISDGKPTGGRVSYYAYTDSACKRQVQGIDLGSVTSASGIYAESNAVRLPKGTYFFQAIYSGNSSVDSGRSACTAVLTVARPCRCMAISAYLSNMHLIGAGINRVEFKLHTMIRCEAGGGGCAGTVTVIPPTTARFLPNAKPATGAALRLGTSAATITFICAGRCAARRVQPPVAVQWQPVRVAHTKQPPQGRPAVAGKLVPASLFARGNHAGGKIALKLVERCQSRARTVMMTVVVNARGQVNYASSDLNGDGRPDGRPLNDQGGFARR